ncbi:DUF1648 domain-containing protein [Plantactinospora mayteni]|uniref:Membrane protein n=1 Tax=Plantactinospora mayteni TaxID=566021 RepID=A0ABQ4ELY1_9ACTN|nr:DUF5808 domain-containing protein [Plantactinospora mayteni]GIG95753.1 membrane protein [Plantactinospora mayteni]
MMTAAWINLALLTIVGSAWMMPSVQRPTLPFGVRVPAQRAGDAAIAGQVRTFRGRVAASGLVGLLTAVALTLTVAGDGDDERVALVGLAPTVALMLLVALFYLRARQAIQRVKAEDGWYSGVAQRVAVDTSLRTGPERLPWPWVLPALLVPLVTLAVGIAGYPEMPERVPIRTNGSTVVAWQAKSPWVVGVPVAIELVTTVLLVALVAWSYRSRPDLEPSAPRRSALQHRLFLRRVSRALLVLATCGNLTILFAYVPIWQGRAPGPLATAAMLLSALLGTAYVVVVAVRAGQGGSRIATVPAPSAERPDAAHTDDDRYWRFAGLCYVNRDDPAILVQKRIGVGWTFNFGNPRSLLLLAAVLAALLAGILVPALG